MRHTLLVTVLAAGLSVPAAAQNAPPEARLLRFPDIRGDVVVFVYAGDLWRASTSGGPALRLTSHPGVELFPKLSPDGLWIAYSAEYSGSRQVWVMPAAGGPPKQLTFYTDVGPMPPRGGWDDWVMGWTHDGKILVRMNRTPWGERMGRYFVVDPRGGLESPLPIPEGGSASFGPGGVKLAYCPVDREFRTWKRSMGGRAQDIWIYDQVARKSERITDWRGTDNFPMWWKDTIYFMSDREHTLNIFAYDTRTRATRRVTDFKEYDVLWPSLGDGQIVFMNGGHLWRLDLASEKPVRIPITLGEDLPARVPHFVDVKDRVQGGAISPGGARAVLEARGDLFSVPAKDGPTRNLTGTQGVREHSASWSPDGKSIAYLSDASGEYEIYVRAQDGGGEPRRVTTNGSVWRFAPVWSRDGKRLLFADRSHRLVVLDVATGRETELDRLVTDDPESYSFSPDSRWVVYQKPGKGRRPRIWIRALDQKGPVALGDGLTADYEPVFSADGKHLFFLSDRDFNRTQSSFEFNYVYTKAARVYVAALAPATAALFPEKSDEERGDKPDPSEEAKPEGTVKGRKAGDGSGKKEAPKKDPEPVVVSPDGFTSRTIAVPGLKADDLRSLAVSAEALFYLKGDDGPGTLYRYDLKDRKEEKVADGVSGYDLSANGKRILLSAGKDWAIVDAKPGAKLGDGKLDLSDLRMKLDPGAEWRQVFDDAWRITRDWFYDPKMHGVDWPEMRKRYGALVPYVAHRADLDFVLGEMISELGAGHTYVTSGDEPRVPRIEGGMLGCEFVTDPSGRYRISKIYSGENWSESSRSPLTEPGVDVTEGELLLAVDGQELKAGDNPYRLLEGKAERPVVLTVARASAPGSTRQVTVRPIKSELDLFYLDWVRSRAALVDRLSGGRIGYLHLPNTGAEGNRMLQKTFYAEAGKAALIIDDRYNGGGFIPDRMIEYFSRRTLARWARNGGEAFATPGFAHDGPKAMLINAYSSSGGDALPYFFRKLGLGTLIGTRTWGGLIGLSGNPPLVDGGSVNVPTFRIYDEAGRWVVENEGVSPDIEVFDTAEERIAGHDPSLEKAVEVLLAELGKRTAAAPAAPVPPVLDRR